MVQIKSACQTPFGAFILSLGLIACLYWGAFQLTPEINQNPPQAKILDYGARDFPVYWVAWQLHRSGENIYSLEATKIHRTDSITIEDIIHNPPWSLWLVAPIAWLPYKLAHSAWMLLNFLLIPLAIFLSLKLFQLPNPRPVALIPLCVFAPTFLCWHFGQLTLALTVVAYMMLIFHQKKWDWAVGACLAVMTIKPHIYFLLAFLIGLFALWQWRWRIFAGFGVSMTVLLSPYWITGSSVLNWIEWVGNGQAALWMTTTISTWIRIFIAPESGLPATWPLYAIPGTALFICFIWFILKRHTEPNWIQISIPLLAISLITAPYSWAYDACLLVGWHVLLLSTWTKTRRFRAYIAVLSTACFFIQLSLIGGDMHWLIWFPFIVLASWLTLRWSDSSITATHEPTNV